MRSSSSKKDLRPMAGMLIEDEDVAAGAVDENRVVVLQRGVIVAQRDGAQGDAHAGQEHERGCAFADDGEITVDVAEFQHGVAQPQKCAMDVILSESIGAQRE